MSNNFGCGMAGGNGGMTTESTGERDARVAETVRQMADALFVRQTVDASPVLQALAARQDEENRALTNRIFADEATWAEFDAQEAAFGEEWSAAFAAEAERQQAEFDASCAAYSAQLDGSLNHDC